MKRLSLAALAALGLLTPARADEGAYRNLVGMAHAAADPGPDADGAPADPRRGTDALKAALVGAPAAAALAAAKPAGTVRGAPDADAAPAAATAPRPWFRLYATLLPSWRGLAAPLTSSEPSPSTAAFRTSEPLPALMPPPDSEAVKAGERRGLAELLSTSAAETGGQ